MCAHSNIREQGVANPDVFFMQIRIRIFQNVTNPDPFKMFLTAIIFLLPPVPSQIFSLKNADFLTNTEI